METDADKKGSLCLNIARILRSQNKFSQSRTYAYKALDYKPSWENPICSLAICMPPVVRFVARNWF